MRQYKNALRCKNAGNRTRSEGGMRMRKRWMTLLLCLCLVFTMLPATAFAGEEQAAGTGTQTDGECICTGLCGDDSVNQECPVCGAEGADLTACKGEGTRPDTPEALTEAPTDMTESTPETFETEDTMVPDSSEMVGGVIRKKRKPGVSVQNGVPQRTFMGRARCAEPKAQI